MGPNKAAASTYEGGTTPRPGGLPEFNRPQGIAPPAELAAKKLSLEEQATKHLDGIKYSLPRCFATLRQCTIISVPPRSSFSETTSRARSLNGGPSRSHWPACRRAFDAVARERLARPRAAGDQQRGQTAVILPPLPPRPGWCGSNRGSPRSRTQVMGQFLVMRDEALRPEYRGSRIWRTSAS